MKAAAVAYERPGSLSAALDLISENPGAKPLAGGQSMGPLMNLRLAQPDLLVDVTAIQEMTACWREGDVVVFGACVTHAAVEDGRTIDPGGGFLAAVAGGIAYRAVRNRGTMGGSLAHADPAADWPTALMAFGASVRLESGAGARTVPLSDFLDVAFEPKLYPGELLTQVRVPTLSQSARFGYYKVCRKTGEYAHAMAAVFVDPERDVTRAIVGATDARPIEVDVRAVLKDPEAAVSVIAEALPGLPATVRKQQTVALARAARKAE